MVLKYISKFFNSKKIAITRNEIDPMKKKIVYINCNVFFIYH